ncbi:MAG: hypothetical protein A3G41_08595 [Elusimicrobia bacterium RIFCSPLOWO2_12_FULL_59_9]|nr:MAG: hypothetical protein A3G41_08595 [Elusimicrobia bacterium RIFCSPLOWO2_12_FULL_59_9]
MKRTVLYEEHVKMGGRLVDFHGWELPVQFSGILEEHGAVRGACGVFDVSHMGQVFVSGQEALGFLQKINSNDVSKIGPGKAVYSHLLNENGGVVDDVIVSCLESRSYLVVVNAATTEKDVAWFKRHASGFKAAVEPASERYAMVALQGPRSEAVVRRLFPEAAALPRFGIKTQQAEGREVFVSRTGYTGEDGFEFIAPNESMPALYRNLVEHGKKEGLVPCGLGARDTLRLEAGYLLYGQDVDDEHTPLEAGYGWVVKWNKGDFIGREALLRQKSEGLKRGLIGLELLDRGVPRPSYPFFQGSRRLGELASATFSPTLKKGIGVGYVDRPGEAPAFKDVSVLIHGRKAPARVVPLPFYKTAAKGERSLYVQS